MSDFCTRLNRAVTQQKCGLCWLAGRGDVSCIPPMEWKGEGYGKHAEWSTGDGWDACRAKHIKAEEDGDANLAPMRCARRDEKGVCRCDRCAKCEKGGRAK